MKVCQECDCDIDEDFDEAYYTDDGDGPFCEECFDEVVEDRAQITRRIA